MISDAIRSNVLVLLLNNVNLTSLFSLTVHFCKKDCSLNCILVYMRAQADAPRLLKSIGKLTCSSPPHERTQPSPELVFDATV